MPRLVAELLLQRGLIGDVPRGQDHGPGHRVLQQGGQQHLDGAPPPVPMAEPQDQRPGRSGSAADVQQGRDEGGLVLGRHQIGQPREYVAPQGVVTQRLDQRAGIDELAVGADRDDEVGDGLSQSAKAVLAGGPMGHRPPGRETARARPHCMGVGTAARMPGPATQRRRQA